jgi:hypothetical protein
MNAVGGKIFCQIFANTALLQAGDPEPGELNQSGSKTEELVISKEAPFCRMAYG